MQRILLTGANGYIGRRLKHKLLQDSSIALRLLVRHNQNIDRDEPFEVVEGSTFDTESLDVALVGVDTAYYLIHSMESENYQELDRQSAHNFLDACIKAGVKRIIYLGGLGEKESASQHLLSRIETGEILSSRPSEIQTLWFRAGVIIGSGSASFEIIRHLVEKLPFMITPKWVNTLCQPISEHDVINYLCLASSVNSQESSIIDIGAPVMSYKELLLGYADAVGLERTLIPVPFFTPKLSSYWLTIMTPVPYSVASALIEGLRSEVVVKNNAAKTFFPAITPIHYADAVQAAVEEIKNTQVISRWSDASGQTWESDHSSLANAVFIDRQIVALGDVSRESLYKTFCCVGGDNGWFGYDLLWEIRGFMDKTVGGYGLSRGRRDAKMLRIGDSVDFWKVVDLVENKRLLLFAQMKLPGKAWLEYLIKGDKLYQSAYFYPEGLAGRLYWYILIPIHFFVFRGMAKNMIKKASKDQLPF